MLARAVQSLSEHCRHVGALTLLLQMLLLLLKHLLLRGGELVHRVRARTGTRRHTAHHGGIDLASWAGDGDVAASELVRHAAGRALLAGVGRHSGGPHGMSSNSRMSHGRVPREVGAHTRSHHLSSRSAIHSVDIDKRLQTLLHAHTSEAAEMSRPPSMWPVVRLTLSAVGCRSCCALPSPSCPPLVPLEIRVAAAGKRGLRGSRRWRRLQPGRRRPKAGRENGKSSRGRRCVAGKCE